MDNELREIIMRQKVLEMEVAEIDLALYRLKMKDKKWVTVAIVL